LSRPTRKGGAPGRRGWTTVLGVRVRGPGRTGHGSREIANALTRTAGGGRVLGQDEGPKAGRGLIHHGTLVILEPYQFLHEKKEFHKEKLLSLLQNEGEGHDGEASVAAELAPSPCPPQPATTNGAGGEIAEKNGRNNL
jgi:hypothetical protein